MEELELVDDVILIATGGQDIATIAVENSLKGFDDISFEKHEIQD